MDDGDCMVENNILAGESVLFDPTDFPVYSSEYVDEGDAAMVFDDLVVFNDTVYNASAVGALLQPVCELFGGNYYLFEVDAICEGSPFLERTPYCTGMSCNVSQLVASVTRSFSELNCTITNERFPTSESILKGECALATSALMAK